MKIELKLIEKTMFIIVLLLNISTANAKDQKTFSELWEIESNKSGGYLTNPQMQELYDNEYKRVDKLLNEAYKKVIKNFNGNKKEITNLKKSQIFWIKYKESECYAQAYPMRDGTGEYTMILPCLIELTEQRTKILKKNY